MLECMSGARAAIILLICFIHAVRLWSVWIYAVKIVAPIKPDCGMPTLASDGREVFISGARGG